MSPRGDSNPSGKEDDRVSGGEPPGADVEGGLAELLELEEQLGQRLAAGQDEATRIVEAAREQAAELESGSAPRLREALDELRGQIEQERDAKLGEIEARADAEASRYEQVQPQTIDKLARWLASRAAARHGTTEP